MLDEIFSSFGAPALVVAMLYVAALQAVTGAIKATLARARALDGEGLALKIRSAGEALGVIAPEAWVLASGVASGPIVWPFLWRVAELEAAAPTPIVGAILGVGSAGVAALVYPLVTQRLTRRLLGK